MRIHCTCHRAHQVLPVSDACTCVCMHVYACALVCTRVNGNVCACVYIVHCINSLYVCVHRTLYTVHILCACVHCTLYLAFKYYWYVMGTPGMNSILLEYTL